MKILDKIGSWIDKLDAKIFGKENYQPLAGQGFVAALKTAVGRYRTVSGADVHHRQNAGKLDGGYWRCLYSDCYGDEDLA